jgi:hypothetical protein
LPPQDDDEVAAIAGLIAWRREAILVLDYQRRNAMSVSGVSGSSSTSGLYQPVSQSSSSQKDVRDSFKQMADAIQSGDLNGAQNAYASLAQLLNMDQDSDQSPTNPQSSTNSDASNFTALLGQIGDSLQSGDLSGAQQTLQSLQQTAQGSHHRHHHGGGSATSQTSQSDPSASAAAAADSTSSTSTSSTSSGVNLTI